MRSGGARLVGGDLNTAGETHGPTVGVRADATARRSAVAHQMSRPAPAGDRGRTARVSFFALAAYVSVDAVRVPAERLEGRNRLSRPPPWQAGIRRRRECVRYAIGRVAVKDASGLAQLRA